MISDICRCYHNILSVHCGISSYLLRIICCCVSLIGISASGIDHRLSTHSRLVMVVEQLFAMSNNKAAWWCSWGPESNYWPSRFTAMAAATFAVPILLPLGESYWVIRCEMCCWCCSPPYLQLLIPSCSIFSSSHCVFSPLRSCNIQSNASRQYCQMPLLDVVDWSLAVYNRFNKGATEVVVQ